MANATSDAIDMTSVSSDTGGRDDLEGIVLMGSNAALADRSELENAECDYECGTNLAETLEIAAKSMNGQGGRAVVLSDFFATVYTDVENKFVFG